MRFIAKWSLVAVPDSPGEYLTADDIADGMLPRITAGIECFSINRPTAGEVDMAIDWMLTVGGTFIDFSGGLISNDVRWLEVTTEPDDGLLVFVVDDASRAHAAYRSQRSPTGIWDVRNGFDGVPVIVRRPIADYPPEVRWNGWLVVLHDGEIEVQTVPDHAFWGKPPRDVEPEITYWAENWAVRDVGGVLTAAHRDGRIVSIEVSANGPVVLSE
ncbi:hypothetical protein [Tsukamurella ocularis]|uniref:hypothetical protein n=1 Tax=Tsukamurella ocularis TaxID=1970234 RepID=UPI0021676DA2|nr:hypothetical protein [Tsukamurella ocularis]MCS3779992.1 hypothetical protein [Tsukamurella ocularis]MCS3788608.1 hypothetical protein [Tsukamurella ocularis]MCS3849818.1 hypothetical protein [Tsukamurella ocularis]